MKNSRKCIATVLVFSMVISVAGCSGNFDESMVNIADKVCGCIADGDYSKASKYFDDKNKKLEEAMIFDSDDDTANSAAELILDTMTYEVDEDSFESDFFGKEGTIDAVFTYVDYEKVLDSQDIFKDFQSFEEALEECDDTVEFSVTLEFEKQDGNVVLVNSGDLIDLFSFNDIEIELAGSLCDYVTAEYFDGPEYDSVENLYTDTDEILYTVTLCDAGIDLDWDYYYIVEGPDGYDESDVINKPAGEGSINIVVSARAGEEFVADGTYFIDVYDTDDNYIASNWCEVTHYEPEPEPEPAYTGTDLIYYVDSTTSPVTLYGGNVVFTAPSGWNIEPADSQYVIGGNTADNPLTAYTALVVRGDTALVNALYLPSSISSAFSDEQMLIEAMASGAQDDGETITYSTVDREICGQTVTCYEACVEGNGSQLYMAVFIIEVDDTTFFVSVGGDQDAVETCCNAFSVAG